MQGRLKYAKGMTSFNGGFPAGGGPFQKLVIYLWKFTPDSIEGGVGLFPFQSSYSYFAKE